MPKPHVIIPPTKKTPEQIAKALLRTPRKAVSNAIERTTRGT